jgi:hypothetical protein
MKGYEDWDDESGAGERRENTGSPSREKWKAAKAFKGLSD